MGGTRSARWPRACWRWLAVGGGGACLALPTLASQTPQQTPAQNPAPAADAAFDAALPPLSATAPPPGGPAPPPLVASPPVIPDSAITQPLVPLGQFDATPPPAMAAQSAEPAERIRYTTVIVGLAGLTTDAPEGSVERAFRRLSALLHDGAKAANAAQVQARADEDVQLATRLLRASGYYDAVASAAVDLVPGQPGVVRVTLTATPGPRYALGHIAVSGAAPPPTRIALGALGLKPGDPLDAALIEGAEANVSLKLPEAGYPFARLGERDIALDDSAHLGDYTLPLDAGPKARFAALRALVACPVQPLPSSRSASKPRPAAPCSRQPIFTPRHLAIFPRFKPGDIYDSRKVEDLRQALVGTSLFSTIAIAPQRTGATNPDGTENVDLLVTETKGPWHSLAASAGYGTGQGVTLTGSYAWRNLSPPEGALILTAVAGTQEQGGSVTFRRADAGQRDRAFQALLSVDRTAYAAYTADTADLSVSWSRASTPIYQKRWTWSFGGEVVGTTEQGAALTLGGARPYQHYLIGAIPLQLGYDRSNDLLNPAKGFRLTVKLSPETSLKGSGLSPYVRSLLLGTGYVPLGRAVVLAGRVQIGTIIGAPLAVLAPSRRFYAGGGGSVRGYGYQQLGPKDPNGDPIGGRDDVEFGTELRYRFGNFGIVPFFDGGRVGSGAAPGVSGMRYGAGVGARYYTNFGPLRLDIATPIARRPGESAVAVYIGIGQAF